MGRNKDLVLGVDVGGTGTKGAIINVRTGEMKSERAKILTPIPATPAAVAKTIKELAHRLNWKKGLVGCGFPAVVSNGQTRTATNIDRTWANFAAQKYLRNKTGLDLYLLNDADAAGIAEVEFGKAKGKRGTVLLLTLGTGIGSALFIDGTLIPNTELGMLWYRDSIVEKYLSNKARKDRSLSFERWGKELSKFLDQLALLLAPELIILSGGVSKRFDQYKEFIKLSSTKVTAAKLINNAGIVGAAVYASQQG